MTLPTIAPRRTPWPVDLYSDTKTRPTQAMRQAMAAAEVGDEQQDEDPTVAALIARVATLLGKPDAIFLPSGTMANVVSAMVHCRPGDEILAESASHVLHFETGGAAAIAHAMVTPLAGERGVFGADTLAQAIRPPRHNAPRPRLVWIEQTTNLGGGAVWPIEVLQKIAALAADHDMAVHVDGARLMNAAIAADVAPAAYGAIADSVWIDFTKGLGAPFGAVLAGSAEFVALARRYKHMLGGAMRQAGMMAAACAFALDHHVERLADDHAQARRLADALAELPGLRLAGPVETNILLVDTSGAAPAQAIADALVADGVRVGVFGPFRLRLITHLDVGPGEIDRAIGAFAALSRRGWTLSR